MIRMGGIAVLCGIAVAPAIAIPAVGASDAAASRICIVGQSSRTMEFAAAELAAYLGRMTSRQYTVAQGDGSDAAVGLGIDPSLGGDGYRIGARGEQVRIDGGDPRGCMYGVYEYLRSLGCRWPLPGKQYEVVPIVASIAWSGPDKVSKPAIRRRGMLTASHGDESLIEYVDFLAKNGFNFVFLYLTSNMTDELSMRLASVMADRDMGLDYGGHWLPGLLSRDLFKDHPEYFRMDNGQRTPDLNMCASNPEAEEIMAKSAQAQVDYMSRFSRPERLHLWPDDIFGGGWCSCEKCRDLSGSDQLLQVLNGITARLNPGPTKVAHIAYHGTVYPPTKVKPTDRTCLMYAARERCYRHGLDECEANRRYLQYLKDDIHAMPDGAEVFDYHQDCILFRFMAVPLHPTIGKDVRIYKSVGVDGVFSHAFQQYSNWAYGPNAYVLGKALWRGEGSDDDIREYCDAVYGPAGKSMKGYFDALFEFAATSVATCWYPDCTDMRFPPIDKGNRAQVEAMTPLVSEANVHKIEGLLAEALNVGREPYRARVSEQKALWRFTHGEVLSIYETLQANERESEIAKEYADPAPVPPALREEMIGLYRGIVDKLEAGTKLIVSTPESVRGWWGGAESGAIGERTGPGYVTTIKERLERWEARPMLK